MQAYILKTGRVISPFDRPAAQMKIHNRTLGETQRQILQSHGCDVEPIDDVRRVRRFPCLLLYDDVYLTHHALTGFLKAARRGENARAALAVSDLTERFMPAFQGSEVGGQEAGIRDQGSGECLAAAGTAAQNDHDALDLAGDPPDCRAYDLYYLKQFDPDKPLVAQATPLPIPHRQTKKSWRVNRHFEPSGRFLVPVSLVYLAPIAHWSSLIAANMLGLPSFLLRTALERPLAAAALPLEAILRSGSLRPSMLLGKTYLAGRRCRVHPSAYVECSLLGNRVRIGPGAVVRNCVLGDGAQIGPTAIVEGCTLGNRATAHGGIVLQGSVADAEAGLGSGFNQMSVFGRGAVMCPDSGILDFSLRGTVQVKHEGRSVQTGSRMLGCCLGDEAFLGAGVRVLCGQEVPNGCVLIRSPRWLVRDPEAQLPEDVWRMDRDGHRRMSGSRTERRRKSA